MRVKMSEKFRLRNFLKGVLPFAAAGALFLAYASNKSGNKIKPICQPVPSVQVSYIEEIEEIPVKTSGIERVVEEIELKEIPKLKQEETHIKDISKSGLDLVKGYESFSPIEYICPAGKPTIGYGHVVRNGEQFGKISKDVGEALLDKDMDFAEKAVYRYVSVPLNQNQYDALCSLIFNIGEGNFSKSTLLKKLNSKDYSGASKEFSRWVYASGEKLRGLERRRNEERQLFLK